MINQTNDHARLIILKRIAHLNNQYIQNGYNQIWCQAKLVAAICDPIPYNTNWWRQ